MICDSSDVEIVAEDLDWNCMPLATANDSSIALDSDTVTDGSDRGNSSMLDTVTEIEKRLLSMVLLNVDITEIYSPERVTAVCKRFGLIAGSSMDLLSGWDFDTAADRRRAEETIQREKTNIMIRSPPCAYFLVLQEHNRGEQKQPKMA